MTLDILRTFRKRDHLHQKLKKSGKPKDRDAFLKHKHLVQHKLKTAHSEYLENLLGLSQTTNDKPDSSSNPNKCSPQKLFSYIKNTRQDSFGIAPLRKNELLHSENKVKADILNQQFQSVFTQKSPLNLEHSVNSRYITTLQKVSLAVNNAALRSFLKCLNHHLHCRY